MIKIIPHILQTELTLLLPWSCWMTFGNPTSKKMSSQVLLPMLSMLVLGNHIFTPIAHCNKNMSVTVLSYGEITDIGVVNHPGTRKCPGGPDELPGVTRTFLRVIVNMYRGGSNYGPQAVGRALDFNAQATRRANHRS